MTECKQAIFGFQGIKRKRVEAQFNGEMVTIEAGALLVRDVCEFFSRLNRCFSDYRSPQATQHSLPLLLEQRV